MILPLKNLVIEILEKIIDEKHPHYEGATISGWHIIADKNNDNSIYMRIDSPKK